MKLIIGSDHAGFRLKEVLKEYLIEKNYAVEDAGTYSADRADYPDFAHIVAKAIENGKADMGILMCGSGNGINIAANRHRGIRSALCWNAEIASLARAHNDANVLALPARYLSEEEAKKIVDAFLSISFEGGRHVGRINKIEII